METSSIRGVDKLDRMDSIDFKKRQFYKHYQGIGKLFTNDMGRAKLPNP